MLWNKLKRRSRALLNSIYIHVLRTLLYIPPLALPLTEILFVNQRFWYLWAIRKDKRARELRTRIVKLFIQYGSGYVKIRTRKGFVYKVNPFEDAVISRQLFLNGYYEEGTAESVQRLLEPGDTFVDVGANIGEISLPASQRVGSQGIIIAIEAMPSTAQLLRDNIRLNDLPDNIIVQEIALSNRNDTVHLFTPPNNLGATRAILTPDQSEVARVSHLFDDITIVSLDADNRGQPVLAPFAAEQVRITQVQARTFDTLIEELRLKILLL